MASQFIHPTAQVDPAAVIVANNTTIGQNAQVGPEVSAGVNVTIGSYTKIYGRVHISHNVAIGQGVTLVGPLEISRHVKIGDGAAIGVKLAVGSMLSQTSLGVSAHIQEGAQVYGRLEVGEYACVQPGACLQGDLPHHGRAAGDPAALTDFVCECGRPYEMASGFLGIMVARCPVCSSDYHISKDLIGHLRHFLLPNHQAGQPVPGWWQPGHSRA